MTRPIFCGQTSYFSASCALTAWLQTDGMATLTTTTSPHSQSQLPLPGPTRPDPMPDPELPRAVKMNLLACPNDALNPHAPTRASPAGAHTRGAPQTSSVAAAGEEGVEDAFPESRGLGSGSRVGLPVPGAKATPGGEGEAERGSSFARRLRSFLAAMRSVARPTPTGTLVGRRSETLSR